MPTDLALLDGIAQAALIRNREVTPLELVDAAIARIEQLNPQLNAVITPSSKRPARRRRVATSLTVPSEGFPSC